MRRKNINSIKFSFLAALLVLLVFAGCKKEEDIGLPPTANLETLIAEAENLIATSEEGTSPGDFQPGSVQKLQDVLIWVDWQIANASKQADIDNAAIRLQKQIEIFKASTVQLAIPIWNNSSGSWIEISENIKSVLDDNFTIEIEAYYLGAGWIETIFSAGEGDSGGPWGFNIRSFGDRFDLVIGAGSNGWFERYYEGGAGLKLGEWVHYALTKSGTNWTVYMDGVAIISVSDGPAETLFNASVPFTLGETAFWPGRAYNGMLKDFRVWSTVRTSDQLIANKDVVLEGNEASLEVYFPLDSNLGSEFKDNTGNYTATFVGTGVVWAPDGVPPVIVLDFAALDAAIADAETLKASVVEGTNDGDYPVGTIDYIQALIDEANDVKETAEKQNQVDAMTSKITDKLKLVESNLVADADGVYIDRENPNAVGLRISPNFTPTADYTIEFDIKLKTLMLEAGDNGEIFCNGTIGLRYFGYNEPTEEGILNSGGLWNFNAVSGAWVGPYAPAQTMKSGIWQHIAIVHDDVAQTTTIYVDGVEVGMETQAVSAIAGDDGIWVGNYWSKMNGSIKDWRMWDIVRDPADLNADITGSEANLQMYFPLDKVAGIGFKDVTGNYNAELRGIEWNK